MTTTTTTTTQEEREMPVHNYNIQKMVAVHHYFEDHIVRRIVEDYLLIDEDSDREITEPEASEALCEWCWQQSMQIGVDLCDVELDENDQLTPTHYFKGQAEDLIQDERVIDYLKAVNALENDRALQSLPLQIAELEAEKVENLRGLQRVVEDNIIHFVEGSIEGMTEYYMDQNAGLDREIEYLKRQLNRLTQSQQ